MSDNTYVSLPDRIVDESRSALDELARLGAQEMLMKALENEVAEYVQRHACEVDENGKRTVVRNGKMPGRNIVSGVGPLEIEQPRIDDRRPGRKFTSQILPPFLRRMPSVDSLIPVLYLKGISTGDFREALTAILGDNVAGLSATNIVRLKSEWEQEYQTWEGRSLARISQRNLKAPRRPARKTLGNKIFCHYRRTPRCKQSVTQASRGMKSFMVVSLKASLMVEASLRMLGAFCFENWNRMWD
mgnify:CR=1 FL=1